MDNNNFNQNSNGYNQNNDFGNEYNQNYNQSYNQNNGYNQNYNENYNQNNEYNQDYNQNFNQNNGYNQNYNQNYNQGNGYNQNYNSNHNQNGYDPNYNPNYPPDMNQYNPIPAPNQYRNCKTRNVIAVLCCILLGFVLFFDGIMISIKVGVLSEGSFMKLIEDTGIIDGLRNDIIAEIDKEFIKDIEGNFGESIDEWMEYITQVIFDNKIPQKEEVRKTIENIYVDFFDIYIDEIIKDIRAKGGIDVDELFTVSEFGDSMDKEAYEELKRNIESAFGNRIVLDSSNQEEFRRLMLDFAEDTKEKSVSEMVDEMYDSLVEIRKEIYYEVSDISITEIMEYVEGGIMTLITVLSIIAVICIAVTVIIDKQISVTLRGLFAPLFVPGIILLFFSFISKGFMSVVVKGMSSEVPEMGKVVESLSEIIINPFIICAVVFIAVGILCKIIGTMTRTENDDKF
ncbi:MAG: hypothetical protein K2M73_06735 [Lachnospiraceae bacterium]|nr:hypothetical protein [Lachnospiraceae bacterium]